VIELDEPKGLVPGLRVTGYIEGDRKLAAPAGAR
jgi:hypothetical protein